MTEQSVADGLQLESIETFHRRLAELVRRVKEHPESIGGINEGLQHLIEAKYESIESHTAAAIMGKNFFGTEEWRAHYGVSFTPAQFKSSLTFPWSLKTLFGPCPFFEGKKVYETHCAFLGVEKYNGPIQNAQGALNICGWHRVHNPAHLLPWFKDRSPDAWFLDEEFALVPLQPKWYLALVRPVLGSFGKSWAEMEQMIPEGYEMPSAIEELTKVLIYHRRYQRYYVNDSLGATRSLTRDGDHVVLGGYESGVLIKYWDGDAKFSPKLSLFRKPKT